MAKLRAGVYARPGKKGTAYQKRFMVNGKKLSVSVTIPNTDDRKLTDILRDTVYPELDRLEQEKRKKIEHGVYKTNDTITVKEYFEDVMIRKQDVGIKDNTVFNYRNVFYCNLDKLIGREKVINIDVRKAQDVFDTILRTKTQGTAERCLGLLHMVFKKAVKQRIIIYNPFDSVEKPKSKKKKTQAIETIHKALTVEQLKELAPYFKKSYQSLLIVFLFCTGLRCGEACALEWSDIDYKNNRIHINKTVSRDINGNLTISSPKTEASERDIPLTDTVKKILEKVREDNERLGYEGDRIFHNRKGGILRTIVMTQTLVFAINKHDEDGNEPIGRRTIHSTRDTWASLAIRSGMTERMVEDCLGHAKHGVGELYAQTYFDDIYAIANKMDFSYLIDP
mgnify:CR=1 FL=1